VVARSLCLYAAQNQRHTNITAAEVSDVYFTGLL